MSKEKYIFVFFNTPNIIFLIYWTMMVDLRSIVTTLGWSLSKISLRENEHAEKCVEKRVQGNLT